MLSLPTTGISRSISTHNVDLDTICDWIEATVLFDEEELSQSDICDTLIEENIYENQDMAFYIISSAWSEIRKRQSWLGEGTPFNITSNRISRLLNWKNVSAHSFCLILSISKYYRGWTEQFGSDYTEQGELFEQLAKESLEQQFKDWEILLTGWSSKNATGIKQLVSDIASKLGESVGNVSRWTSESRKDAELDILFYRPFKDQRVGIPVFLMQCASGRNWETKRHTPNLKLWTKIIDFAVTPTKAFAIPYAIVDKSFVENCNLVDGLFLDRYRILAATNYKKKWISKSLKARLVNWLKPRINALPRSH
ncbi:MAG: hypothetical protein CEE38_07325 [Planctomycetes bacterium B3_Pla]|nr:MAG: hypothetical protein CEE38_07325 [Planctomycetes bacterium B3_Pla]